MLYDRTKRCLIILVESIHPKWVWWYKICLWISDCSLETSKSKSSSSFIKFKNDLQNLEKASVKSSIDGIVLNKEVEIGRTLQQPYKLQNFYSCKDLTNMDLVGALMKLMLLILKDNLDVTFYSWCLSK